MKSNPSEETEQKETEPGRRDLSDIPASPSVRRLAREQGVDLTKVKGSGPGNRISAEDIKSLFRKTCCICGEGNQTSGFLSMGTYFK